MKTLTSYNILFFALSMALTSCQPEESPVLFELLEPRETGIDFVNQIKENDSLNIVQYLYYYNGGGVATGDFNKDGLPDLFFTANQGENRLYLNQGDFEFLDVTEAAGVGGDGSWSTGVTVVDINADGWLDIYVCQVGGYKNFKGKNQLFINQGIDPAMKQEIPTVRFSERAADYGLDFEGFSTQSAFFDYDMDGDLDLYLLCHSVHSTETYRDTSSTRSKDERAGDKLLRNDGVDANGNLQFTEVTQRAGIYSGIAGYGLGIALGDVDRNGCPDLYIGNDFHENDFLYLNNCDGTFTESSAQVFGHTSNFSMGNDLADLNNDGWLDLMTLDMKPEDEVELKSAQGPDSYDIYRFKRSFGYDHQLPRNMLHLHKKQKPDGTIRFSEVGQLAGVSATDWSWSVLMADLDNDGWKDLHITNGIIRRPNNLDYLKFISSKKIQENASDLELAAQMPDGKVKNYLFRNSGTFPLKNTSEEWGIKKASYSNGSVATDLDLDGDLDLVINNINEPAFVYRNQAQELSDNHFLQVRFEGPVQNPYGISTSVSLFHQGQQQYQVLYPVRGFQSCLDYTLHFGLGESSAIDSVIVEWPDGNRSIEKAVGSDQVLTFRYSDSAELARQGQEIQNEPLFKQVSETVDISFIHRENRFFDNSREALIPLLLSTQGPKMAVGDIDKDGLDDFFIGGASGQAGQLFRQLSDGSLTLIGVADLNNHIQSEDTGILFFDADGDGDEDLYIGSGGNEYYHEDERLIDRLYFNDGSGHFVYQKDALPVFHNQTSCVRTCDYDADGDLDLFVGTRSKPVNYGWPTDSYLLENNGDGTFINNVSAIPELEKLGMVTDAGWTDIDGDGDWDLVVVGDWMPLTYFVQQEESFYKQTVAKTNGWWNTIVFSDVDDDGDEDWLAGNFGWNSNLQPSLKEPVRLYLRDFDGNLSKDPVLTYYRQGKEFPFEGLDMLSKQMVYLKKRFQVYEKFANSTVTEVFQPEELEKAMVREVFTFATVLVLNEGQKGLTVRALPVAAQEAPVMSIIAEDLDGDSKKDLVLGGNFYELQPAIGRMDASYGVLLKGDGVGNFEVIDNQAAGLWLEGQIRDLKLVKLGNKQHLVAARNNDGVQVFALK